MKRYLGCILVLIFFFNSPVMAQENWVIEDFEVDIQIEQDGWVKVREKIQVDFGELEKHGIYRDIPIEYQDEYFNNLRLEYEVLGVENGFGQKRRYDTFRSGDDVRIKIGDPLETINGNQEYMIDYKIKGVVGFFETHDELYWNVTGNAWPVPILNASVRLRADNEPIRAQCYTGIAGSTGENCVTDVTDHVSASTSNLSVSEGFTVVSAFPVGTVTKPTTWELFWQRLQNNWGYFIPVLTFLLLLRLYFAHGRDEYYRHNYSDSKDDVTIPLFANSVVADRYYPPENVTAAEAGVVIDEKAHSRDIASILISLAELGYLKIKEDENKKYTLLRQNTTTSRKLHAYEQTMLDGLFKKGNEVTLDSLKYSFSSIATKATNQLYEHIVKQKYFYRRPDSVRQSYLAIGGVIAILGVFGIFRGLDSVGGVSVGVGFVISGVLVLLFSKSMPKRTAKGRQVMLDALGLKRVIKLGDYRQQFFERQNYFTEILPFAIAFGLTKQWAKAVKNLQIQQPEWYQGNRPFSATIFSTSMRDFSTHSSKTLTAVKSSAAKGSSGFSSSGGFSGGGFGGGGGGSW